jgi:hypothetical protein
VHYSDGANPFASNYTYTSKDHVTEYYQSTTVGQITVRIVSGKQRWALRQTTCNTPKRLRDCKTQLVDKAPHRLDSGYEDLCVECNLDQ